MLVLVRCLGILHKNPHLLSHLVSSNQCKPWQYSGLEPFHIDCIFFIHNLTFEISFEYLFVLSYKEEILQISSLFCQLHLQQMYEFPCLIANINITFCFPKETNWVDMPEPTNNDSVWPLHCFSQSKFLNGSYVEQNFQSTSRGARKSWWNHQASKSLHICEFPN